MKLPFFGKRSGRFAKPGNSNIINQSVHHYLCKELSVGLNSSISFQKSCLQLTTESISVLFMVGVCILFQHLMAVSVTPLISPSEANILICKVHPMFLYSSPIFEYQVLFTFFRLSKDVCDLFIGQLAEKLYAFTF